jgi:hypothetical protein
MRFPLLVRDALNLLRQHGVAAEVEQGVHYKVRFCNQFGHPCLLIIARSPSARGAFQQNRSELRRLLRRTENHQGANK